ncbi:MraY family glycosyltransferase [Candidatus Korarchaeum cryptofilum]|jgi:UDP-N-acetylglucosamine--dolichyl-phosphate N-acetylglucosaminephosphotransferase|uniref:Glycosyl transferase family 4 n=1 Tax=Korarchaeum cryptofilum (strain OPF8) TaxID=374847 RepID=B1L6W1_KORCO|nr:glycosyltransferase 4 family protein [Candidatus Korarchaeum cryptofilum]ACB08190.1 glycosyl transferase family 4 [Candidatus Korarchaeum cryptofilum OPF8]
MIVALIIALASALAAYLATGRWIRISEERGIVSRDLHKPYEANAAKIGGIPVALTFIVDSSILSIFMDVPKPLLIFPIFFSSIGLLDDLVSLRNSEKIILSGLPFLFLSWLFPSFDPFSPILTQPLTLFLIGTYYVNSTNTYAGFNGLEAGVSLIISSTISLILLMNGDYGGFLYLFSLSLLLFSFLLYNWYPARAFPGNMLTFMCGGTIGAASFLYGHYWPLVILSIPQGLDFLLKLLSWRRTSEKVPARVSGDGTLIPPPNLSLPSLLMRLGVRREPQLVIALLSIELLLASALLIYLPR